MENVFTETKSNKKKKTSKRAKWPPSVLFIEQQIFILNYFLWYF